MDTAAVDWSMIDTVLLDMDGTLLDLRFDNWFWQEHLPSRYAAVHGLEAREARELLEPKFRERRGTLEWYCIDHWSRELGLDIAGMKRAVMPQVGYLPGAEEFLMKLKGFGKRRVLVTNAHPLTLDLKDQRVGLTAHFDACYSTHGFAAAKEQAAFWPRLQARERFVAERTLMVDDSLPVLQAAHGFGIGWLRAVSRPDSGKPAQDTAGYAAIDRVCDLLP
jgi:putative hydrolase of the HAD superfamily